MTDEQIKQNAEEYAKDEKQYYLEIGCYDLICESFIAGAHSRDEEIEGMKGLIKEEAKIRYSLIQKNEELQARLNNPNNLWISVNEQLPTEREEGRFNFKSKPVFAKVQRTDGTIYHLVTCYYFDNNEEPQDGWLLDTSNGDKITQWMKIP